MRLIALLSFYDERPDWLAACVASLSKCCECVVAVDGAYALFPQAKPHSGDLQASAIVTTAQSLDMGVVYAAPETVWFGNEVEKRNHLFELGRTVAQEGDWFLVVDADMLVRMVPGDLKQVLSETDCIVGSYWLEEAAEGQAGRHPFRCLFRAAPDLHITRTHYGYRRGETYLWETGGQPAVATDLLIEHRGHGRSQARLERSDEFDRRRDIYGIETDNPQPVPSV